MDPIKSTDLTPQEHEAVDRLVDATNAAIAALGVRNLRLDSRRDLIVALTAVDPALVDRQRERLTRYWLAI